MLQCMICGSYQIYFHVAVHDLWKLPDLLKKPCYLQILSVCVRFMCCCVCVLPLEGEVCACVCSLCCSDHVQYGWQSQEVWWTGGPAVRVHGCLLQLGPQQTHQI